MLVPGNAPSTAAPSVRSVSWRKRRKLTSNPANDGDLRESQLLVLKPEFVLVMVERVSEVAERPAKATQHTFLLPEHTRCEGLQIPQQERENHAAGKPRRWRQTTWQGHNQHPPRDELPKRGPCWSSCSLSGGSRAAAKKDEITAAHSAEPTELGGGSEGTYYRVLEARKPQRWSCSAGRAAPVSKR